MVDIQSATAENRRGKKDRRKKNEENRKKKERKKKPQDQNIMAYSIPDRVTINKKISCRKESAPAAVVECCYEKNMIV